MAEKSKPGKEKGGGAKAKGEEKVMIIPLKNKARKSAKNKRMNRSVREIKAFLARHMAAEPSSIQISQQLNESLWKGGLHNPPSRIKVKVSTDEEGKVFASLLDEKERAKKESKRKLGLRQRLRRKAEEKKEGDKSPSKQSPPSNEESSRRREASKEETAEAKEKPAAEKKPEPPKEKPKKEPAKEGMEQELMLEE